MATTGLPQIDYSRFSKHGELMLAAGVVIILFVMLVPLPTFFRMAAMADWQKSCIVQSPLA